MKYKDAGVDLNEHTSMHLIAQRLSQELASELGLSVESLGKFAPHINLLGSDVTLHVDGVGTKVLVLKKLNALEVAGWDCIAMNANDIACEGFKAAAFSDYIAMSEANAKDFERILRGMLKALKKVKAPLISGETAILPGLMSGIDVACFVLGLREKAFKNSALANDIVIGVESWGLHANGFSLVRKVVEEKIGGYEKAIGGVEIAKELSSPTAIYYDLILDAIKAETVNGIAHITGGGWGKIKKILGKEYDAELIAPQPQPIFNILIQSGGIPVDEAYRVFNMGVGLVFSTKSDKADKLKALIASHGFRYYTLGKIVPGSGAVRIKVKGNAEITI